MSAKDAKGRQFKIFVTKITLIRNYVDIYSRVHNFGDKTYVTKPKCTFTNITQHTVTVAGLIKKLSIISESRKPI